MSTFSTHNVSFPHIYTDQCTMFWHTGHYTPMHFTATQNSTILPQYKRTSTLFFILCTDHHTSMLYACHHTSRLSTQDTTLPHTVHKPPHLHTSAVQQKIDGSSHLQVLRVISGPAASVSPPLSYNLFLCRSTAAAVPNSRLCL